MAKSLVSRQEAFLFAPVSSSIVIWVTPRYLESLDTVQIPFFESRLGVLVPAIRTSPQLYRLFLRACTGAVGLKTALVRLPER